MSAAVLDTNVVGATAAPLVLTTQRMVTLYVSHTTGTHNNHRVALEFSPDGVLWIPSDETINGHEKFLTVEAVGANVRVVVVEAEGQTSTITVHILAR